MKKFLAKSWKYLILIPIFVAISVGIFLYLPNEDDLVVNAEDISLEVGEEKVINFETNNSDAELSFVVKNEEIAKVEGDKVCGLSVGETELVIVAKLDSSIKYKTCKIFVLPQSQESGENFESEETEIFFKFQFDEISNLTLHVGEEKVITIVSNKPYEFTHSDMIEVRQNFGVPNQYIVKGLKKGKFEIVVECGADTKTLVGEVFES